MWKPDYTEEYKRRLALLEKMVKDEEVRRYGMQAYSLNPTRWIEDWCITYNPRNTKPIPKTLPFLLFPRQKEFIQFLVENVRDRESGLIEKSRDIGATWLCCAFSVWLWLFVPGAAVGWGSRKEQLVDRIGDPDSIFEKMRMMINKLPAFMLPVDFDRRFHLSSMKIINPNGGAVIAGESGDQIGRGGRKMIYFKDEAAHYERPELIEAALGDNTDVQIDISSVNGTNNVFYRRRHAGEIWAPGRVIPPGHTRVFLFDWRDHPLKTQEWYDLRRAKAESEGLLHLFAQEVDRDYTASLDRVIIPAAWIRAAVDAHVKLGFSDDGECRAGLDVADEGGDKNALAITKGVILKSAEHWAEGDTGDTARRAVGECREYGVRELSYDSIGVGAGVKSETNRLEGEGQIPVGLRITPWNAAAKVLNPTGHIIEGDMQSPTNEDFFGNLKAQGWWMLRQRFERTYKAVTQGIKYPSEQLISLPADLPRLQEIIAELSGATQKYNLKGKIIVDKKPDGGRSPNLADSIVIVFTPTREATIFDSM